MITANNYFDYAPKYLSKFNEAMKSGHEIMVDLKAADVKLDDTQVIEGDIAEVVQMQINQLNKLIDGLQAKQDKVTTPTKKETPKAQLPVKKVTKQRVVKAKTTKEIKPVIKKVKPTTKQKAISKSKKLQNISSKKVESGSKKIVKKIIQEEKAKIPVKINKLSIELSIIKGFIGMDGKTITSKGIASKHKSLKAHFDKGHISDHKSVLETIIQKIGKAVEASKDADNVKIKLEKEFKEKCIALVKGAKPKIQVNYLAGVKHNKGVFIDHKGKKFQIIDLHNGLPWANEFFATRNEAIQFTKQNNLKIASPAQVTYPDGFKFKLLTYNEAKEMYNQNKEVFGLDLDSYSEAVIKNLKDLNTFYLYGIELPKK